MISQMFTYLSQPACPVSGRPMAYQRDDDRAPFSDLTAQPVLVRQQPGPAGRDIARRTFDLWLFTKANPSNSDVGQLLADGQALEQYIVANYRQRIAGEQPIFYLDVAAGANGPYLDGQGRQAIGLSITASATTGTP